MNATRASLEELAVGILDGMAETASEMAKRGRQFLATEEGRELRRKVARALILAAPLVGEFPVIRRTWAGRVLRIAGVSAIMIKGAEWIRDWEPAQA